MTVIRSRIVFVAWQVLLVIASVAMATCAFSVQTTPPLTVSTDDKNVVQSFSLFEKKGNDGFHHIDDSISNEKVLLGRCIEVEPPPKDPTEEADEVEQWYATTRRSFGFPTQADDYKQTIDVSSSSTTTTTQTTLRLPSYGCGELGASIWPSGIALAALLAGQDRSKVEGQRILELGAGCGLPSVVAKDVIGASSILSTDYWELEDDGNFDKNSKRSIPKNLFGKNLAYNLGETDLVQRLDWHDTAATMHLVKEYQPHLVVGSDLLYYPMDVMPLLRTLNIIMQVGNAKECILISPLNVEREALDEFRFRFAEIAAQDEDDEDYNKQDLLLYGCDVHFDKLEMIGERGEIVYEFQRFCIAKKEKGDMFSARRQK